MIQLTRINKLPLVLNAELIEQIETTPDTVIQLINGQKFVVLESSEEVVRKVIEYRRMIHWLPVEVSRSNAGATPEELARGRRLGGETLSNSPRLGTPSCPVRPQESE